MIKKAITNVTNKGVFFAGLALLICLLIFLTRRPGRYIDIIKSSFKGVIVEKYFLKTTHLKIKTSDNNVIDVAAVSGAMIKESEVGDSIEKVPNDNYVFLTKKGVRSKLIYIYIPDVIRNDFRWPAEWKDKWRENP
jgi:hypothetical protein